VPQALAWNIGTMTIKVWLGPRLKVCGDSDSRACKGAAMVASRWQSVAFSQH
jgi:hypothetical protein